MEEETFNGWSNYDTWKLHLNLTNEFTITKYLESEIKNMSLTDFINYCVLVKPHLIDSINYSQVNFEEVYGAFRED